MEQARLISQGECETHIHKQPHEGTPDRMIRGFRLSGVAWRFDFLKLRISDFRVPRLLRLVPPDSLLAN
jgi:hypothetical protein